MFVQLMEIVEIANYASAGKLNYELSPVPVNPAQVIAVRSHRNLNQKFSEHPEVFPETLSKDTEFSAIRTTNGDISVVGNWEKVSQILGMSKQLLKG